MSKVLALSFRLSGINTEEYAILEEGYKDGEDVGLATFLEFGIDKERKILGSNVKFQFEQEKKPFMIISVTCGFEIEPDAWISLIDEKSNKLIIPEGFASHLAVFTVGTTRGVLHEKTNGTKFNDYFIPPINLTELITGDIEIDLSDDIQ